MPDERETILEHFKDIIGDVDEIGLSSRDYSRVLTGQVEEYPAAFTLDVGDAVDNPGEDTRENRCVLTVAVVLVIKAANKAAGPSTMSVFRRAVEKQIYGHIYDCVYISRCYRTGGSHISWSPINPNELHQGLQFDVEYIESIVDLLNE